MLDFSHGPGGVSRKYPPQAATAVCGVTPCIRHLWPAWSTPCDAAGFRHSGFFAGRHRGDRSVRSWQCLFARDFFGSFLLNIWISYSIKHQLDVIGVNAALIIALSSMIQAAVGGALLRRLIGYPASFDNLRDLLLFLLLAPVICLISATSSLSGLRALDLVPATDLMGNWITWWVGDTLGVLVALPLMLVLVGEPQPYGALGRVLSRCPWFSAGPCSPQARSVQVS
jgi:MASE1